MRKVGAWCVMAPMLVAISPVLIAFWIVGFCEVVFSWAWDVLWDGR